jgi:flavin reductase (DIM6/NTAB) family NADH-FMN oxidoreductase RutF
VSGAVILVTAVGAAGGSKAAAAALVCAGSEPDRPGILIDVGGRAPRPTLVASAGARDLEERLAVHLPQLRAASRGQTCHLAVPEGPEAFESVRAALPLVRDSVAVIHLPPAWLQEALANTGIRATGAMLRADLDQDRALAALAVRDLAGRGLRTKVLKQALRWVPARRALFGVLPPAAPGALPIATVNSLLRSEISVEHPCYAGSDDTEIDPTGTAQRQRRDHASARRGRGLHRHSQRQAGR